MAGVQNSKVATTCQRWQFDIISNNFGPSLNQWDSPPCVEPLRGDAAACHWPANNRSADNPIELGGAARPSQFLWMGGCHWQNFYLH